MDDTCKFRMNLAAIKKVDPYANDIVDKSPHVAFYTFDSDKNEWEKTDVEGAFFIYSRNGQPYHSIFINNRLNTTSFVEPVTAQLELQSQPPFLLYRNERSRIRGFWFYNSEECDRIAKVLKNLVESNAKLRRSNSGNAGNSDSTATIGNSNGNDSNEENMGYINENISNTNGSSDGGSSSFSNMMATIKQNDNSNKEDIVVKKEITAANIKQEPVNIFSLLTRAQQEFTNSQNAVTSTVFPSDPSVVAASTRQVSRSQMPTTPVSNKRNSNNNISSGSVLEFFAAAKPQVNNETTSNVPIPMSVEEIERQQRTKTPVAASGGVGTGTATATATGSNASNSGGTKSKNVFLQQLNTTPIIQNLNSNDKLILSNIRQQQQKKKQNQEPQDLEQEINQQEKQVNNQLHQSRLFHLHQQRLESLQLKQQKEKALQQKIQLEKQKQAIQQQQQQQKQPKQSSSPSSPLLTEWDSSNFKKLVNQASLMALPNQLSSSSSTAASATTVDEVENQLRNLLAKENKATNIDILPNNIAAINTTTSSTTSLTSNLASTATSSSSSSSTLSNQMPSMSLNLSQESSSVLSLLNAKDYSTNHKPALIPPTMFETTSNSSSTTNTNNNFIPLTEPLTRPIHLQDMLNPSQLAQALIYLMQNDQDFVQKLHEAYVKVSTKSLVDSLH